MGRKLRPGPPRSAILMPRRETGAPLGPALCPLISERSFHPPVFLPALLFVRTLGQTCSHWSSTLPIAHTHEPPEHGASPWTGRGAGPHLTGFLSETPGLRAPRGNPPHPPVGSLLPGVMGSEGAADPGLLCSAGPAGWGADRALWGAPPAGAAGRGWARGRPAEPRHARWQTPGRDPHVLAGLIFKSSPIPSRRTLICL